MWISSRMNAETFFKLLVEMGSLFEFTEHTLSLISCVTCGDVDMCVLGSWLSSETWRRRLTASLKNTTWNCSSTSSCCTMKSASSRCDIWCLCVSSHKSLFSFFLLFGLCVQMDEVLERICAQEKEIASVGTTVVQTEQLLKDLDTLDKHAQVTHKHARQPAHHWRWDERQMLD